MCYFVYAFFLTASLLHRHNVVMLMIGTETFNLTSVLIGELGMAMKSPTVLAAHEVEWDVPSGIMLRSFEGEDASLGVSGIRQKVKQTIETAIVKGKWPVRHSQTLQCLRWLTVVRPGQHFVTPGIQRVALTNESWQWWIIEAIRNAEIIVVFIGKTGGLDWELRRVAAAGRLGSLRLIVLPQNSADDRQAFFAALESSTALPAPALPKNLIDPQMVWWQDGKAWAKDLRPFDGAFGSFVRIMTALSSR
jgi:hypothetical protein